MNWGNKIMSNPMKDIFDKESMIKDIAERENIICNYQKYGLLDKDYFISRKKSILSSLHQC